MNSIKRHAPVLILAGVVALFPVFGFASVESSLSAIQNRLINVILPVLAILGLVWAGCSFVLGSPNARTHLMLAMMGAAVGFGAPSLVSFIRGLIH